MKHILFGLVFMLCGVDAMAATPVARGRAATEQQTVRAARTQSARASNSQSVVSRSATTQSAQPTVQQRGRSATVAAPTQTVSRGRAAKTQSVVGSGTKVAAAAQNTVVDEACWNKFSGCMDSFCMLDNANGGRCLCSNRNSELDSILAEIQELDAKSYEMATAGVEKINMGEDSDAIVAKTEEITQSIIGEKKQSKRDLLDYSNWNSLNSEFEDFEDIFTSPEEDISTQTGDKLFRAAADLCNAQIRECSSQFTMMESLYKQRVRSDCTAYENSLKQQRVQSAQKLAAAQNAMREAALEQYRTANKYDLGQCVFQFKQCMQNKAGCGEDFAACVTPDYTAAKLRNKKPKQTQIQGALTTIEISASTYDALESKQPLCMDITKNCVAVRDQVWDAFLREAAPELKSAELIAESNARTQCTTKITECFNKACRDNIDPSDPEGSYDLCLTRPDTFRSLCKVEIEPCEAMDKGIMEPVYALLASMRVDSCTKDFKACLQSEDRCGSDYTQCIGLDTDAIVRLCPYEKLAACRLQGDSKTVKTEDEIYDELANIAQGIFLSIDNNLLTGCQSAANTAMIKVCGGTDTCDAFSDNGTIGTDSLISYKDGAGSTVIDGLVNFNLLNMNQTESNEPNTRNQTVTYDIDYGDYNNLFGDNMPNNPDDKATVTRIQGAVKSIENMIKAKISIISEDPVVNACINGRDNSWRYTRNRRNDGDTDDEKFTRFPHLLDDYVAKIFDAAIVQATKNYDAEYTKLVKNAAKDQDNSNKEAMCKSMAWTSNDSQYKIDGLEIRRILGGTADGSEVTGPQELKDSAGNIIGYITKTAVYSSSTGICTITTETKSCQNNKSYRYVKDENGNYSYTWVYTACIKWNDPVRTTQEIQM